MKRFAFFCVAMFSLTTALEADISESQLKAVVEKFDKMAEEQRVEAKVPGMAIGIIKGDKVYLAKGYGQKGLNDKSPVDTKTLFQIGSLSKAFTSALVAIQVDAGTLKWDDPVINHLPDFRMHDPWVTTQFQVQDLLAQRSGLHPYAGDIQTFICGDEKSILANIRFLKPISSFRSQFAYQNVFFNVASNVVATKTQKNFSEQVKSFLFEPLGMNDSSTGVEAYLKFPNRAGWNFKMPDGTITVLKEDFKYRNWNYIYDAAGGINSNLEDMLKWLELNANKGKFKGKQIISEESMLHLKRPMVSVPGIPGVEVFYASGWLNVQYSPYPVIMHDGATLGVFNNLAFIPEENVGIVILTNLRNERLAIKLTFQFFDLYFGNEKHEWMKSFAKPTEAAKTEKPVKIYPPMSLGEYIGTYTNPLAGVETQITEENNELVLTLGKNREKFKLKHWNRDIFELTWPIVEDEPSKVSFIMGNDGKIQKFELGLFENGDPEFIKQDGTK